MQLGEKVGLTGDRIQKYENNARKPKEEVLNNIARALEVNPLAFGNPKLSEPINALFAMFELEERFGMRIKKINNNEYGLCLRARTDEKENTLFEYLKIWQKKFEKVKDTMLIERHRLEPSEFKGVKELLESEYLLWKSQFSPELYNKTSDTNDEIRQIEEEIKEKENMLKILKEKRKKKNK